MFGKTMVMTATKKKKIVLNIKADEIPCMMSGVHGLQFITTTFTTATAVRNRA